jgi:hypothetical protein
MLRSLIVAILFTQAVIAADSEPSGTIPPKIRAFLEAKTTELDQRVQSLRDGLNKVRSNRKAFTQEKDYRSSIEAYEKQLENVVEAGILVPVIYAERLELGQWGKMGRGCKVVQVINDSEMHVISGPDDDNIVTFCVKGYSTKGIVDGKFIELQGLFEITETKRFINVRGSSTTVFVAAPLDSKVQAAILSKITDVTNSQRQKHEDIEKAKLEAERKVAEKARLESAAKEAAKKKEAEEKTRQQREDAAEFLLKIAKDFLASKNFDKFTAGKQRLQLILEKYPDTKAAGEATKLLGNKFMP